METIAKMLGHSDIRTTKIYAKVLDTTVSKEMETMKTNSLYKIYEAPYMKNSTNQSVNTNITTMDPNNQ